MPKSESVMKWEQRKKFHNEWKVGLCSAGCKAPHYCCAFCLCPSCASYKLRKRALNGDMKRYRCCGNFFFCSGKMQEHECPECCLCLETWCCFGTSVLATRWLIQDESKIRNDRCDNCMLKTATWCDYLTCICQLAAWAFGSESGGDAADVIEFITHSFWCPVAPCLQSQHHIQINERDRIRNLGDDREEAAPMVPPSGGQGYQYQPAPAGYPPVKSPVPTQGMYR